MSRTAAFLFRFRIRQGRRSEMSIEMSDIGESECQQNPQNFSFQESDNFRRYRAFVPLSLSFSLSARLTVDIFNDSFREQNLRLFDLIVGC